MLCNADLFILYELRFLILDILLPTFNDFDFRDIFWHLQKSISKYCRFYAYWKRGIQLNYTIMVDLINKKDLYTITIMLIALKFIHFNIAIPDMCFISYNVCNFKSGHDRYFWWFLLTNTKYLDIILLRDILKVNVLIYMSYKALQIPFEHILTIDCTMFPNFLKAS